MLRCVKAWLRPAWTQGAERGIAPTMSDRLFYALAALAAVLLIALAVVWPQRPGREAGNLAVATAEAQP